MPYDQRLATCRFCKKVNFESHKYDLIQYAPRHNAHADCLLKAKGSAVFQLLPLWKLEQFSFFAAQEAGLDKELTDEISKRQRERKGA